MSKQFDSALKASVGALIAFAFSVLMTTSAWAHHAFAAEYDAAQPIVIKGTITRFEVTNPHSWIYLDVKAPDGNVTTWGFEFGAPFSLREKGVTKKTLPIGTELTIKGYRAKSGKNYGYAVSATLPDGRTYVTGGAQDAPGQRQNQ